MSSTPILGIPQHISAVFDNNLTPCAVRIWNDLFPGLPAVHVSDLGWQDTPDKDIAAFLRDRQKINSRLVFVTRDNDWINQNHGFQMGLKIIFFAPPNHKLNPDKLDIVISLKLNCGSISRYLSDTDLDIIEPLIMPSGGMIPLRRQSCPKTGRAESFRVRYGIAENDILTRWPTLEIGLPRWQRNQLSLAELTTD